MEIILYDDIASITSCLASWINAMRFRVRWYNMVKRVRDTEDASKRIENEESEKWWAKYRRDKLVINVKITAY